MAKAKRAKTPEEILQDIKTRPTVPLWPHAAWAYGRGRGAIYEDARAGRVETVELGRSRPALTAPLRRRLGIDAAS
jgi:hypothetical protein